MATTIRRPAVCLQLVRSRVTCGSDAVQRGRDRPGHTRATGDAAVENLFSGTISFEAVDPPAEECPLGVRTISDMQGVSNVLGSATLHAEHCPAMGNPSIPHGEFTITGEGGDTITGIYVNDCQPQMLTEPDGQLVRCTGREEVTGGTGRFVGVTGSAQESVATWFPGSLEEQGWPILFQSSGEIGVPPEE